MEGFKQLPKMQCFKEGGYVTSMPKSVVEKTTKVAPTGNKKANAKSAAVAPKEKEDKVDITTMKKGGRAKKAIGTVKKFLKQEAKKPSGDKDAIKKVKPTGNKKANAPSKGAVKGKEIKKFAVGGPTGEYGPEGQNTPMYPYGNGPDTPGYQLDPGYGGGFYPTYGSGPTDGGPPETITPGFGPNLGPTDMPIGTPTNGGGGTLSPYPTNPMQPPVSQSTPGYNPNFNPTFTNNNTFNANGDGGGYGFGGGSNPMQNPGGQQPTPMAYNQAATPAAPAAAGSVNLLPGLFGASK
jgi:hypothetical protein